MAKDKNPLRVYIYDGAEIVGNCHVTNNLDFYNGRVNCNPKDGKHKTISQLKDGSYAIIWYDSDKKYGIGKVVDDEFAVLEIIKAKKYHLLCLKRFEKLNTIYNADSERFENLAKKERANKKIMDSKSEDIIVATQGDKLVAIYSKLKNLKVIKVEDIEHPKEYYKIWGIEENELRKHSKVSKLSKANKKAKYNDFD